MNFVECKEKYFIIVEGEERAIIRGPEKDADRTRKNLAKYRKGQKIFIFKAVERN